MRALLLSLLIAACGSSASPAPEPPEPAKPAAPAPAPMPASAPVPASASAPTLIADAVARIVGTTPPRWHAERWINSAPLELAKLRGQVVLVRWWTAGCPYCSTSAPALRALHRDYAARGLQVIGMYHHKDDTPFDPAVYEQTATRYGFTFPVAFDPEWRTLESWLVDRAGQPVSTGWTSVTFLLDKQGVIRHVHPGGSYVAGEPAHAELTAAIERLLAAS